MDTPRKFERERRQGRQDFAERGITFEFAAAVFADPTRVDFDVSRPEQGEERRKTIGRIGKRLFTVVYTVRGEATRIISARPANRSEERAYSHR